MAFTTLLDCRTIVALLSGLAIGLALGLSGGSSSVLEHRLPEEKAKADALFGNQPASFWIQKLKDRDPALRQQALWALAHLGPKQEGALQAVSEMLKDKHEGVRFGAALNLGRMGPEAKGALPHLLAALEDPDQFVRLGVVRALGTIGPQDATVLAALKSTLQDKNAMVRRRNRPGGIGCSAFGAGGAGG
jgi:HEAT repeat protein